jgi:hypothetical protein
MAGFGISSVEPCVLLPESQSVMLLWLKLQVVILSIFLTFAWLSIHEGINFWGRGTYEVDILLLTD